MSRGSFRCRNPLYYRGLIFFSISRTLQYDEISVVPNKKVFFDVSFLMVAFGLGICIWGVPFHKFWIGGLPLGGFEQALERSRVGLLVLRMKCNLMYEITCVISQQKDFRTNAWYSSPGLSLKAT
jgi:hypothetical protein